MVGLWKRNNIRRRNQLISRSKEAGSAQLVEALESRCMLTVSFTGPAYTQNFDSLATTGTTNAWANDSTINGWFAYQSLTGATHTAGRDTGTWGTSLTTYRADTGTGTSGALYSYGILGTNPLSDRSLGSIGSGTPGDFVYAVVIQNNTGAAISNFTLAYNGEQWRNGGANATQSLLFDYNTFASLPAEAQIQGSTTSGYTSVTGLNFASPIVSSTAGALDGNAAANRTAKTATVNSGFTWASGSYLVLRWFDDDDTGSDSGLSIDDINFSVSATGNSAPVVSGPATASIPNSTSAALAYSVTDTDGNNQTVTINATAGTLTASGGGVTGSGTTSVTITGTLAAVNTALGTLQYNAPATGTTATVTIKSNDGFIDSNTVTTTVTLDVAPTISGPTTASVATNGTYPFPSPNNFTVTDPDSGQTQTLTISVNGGTLTASGTGVSGSGTATVTMTGSVATVNTNLLTLVFNAPASAGTVTMTLSSNDGFNSSTNYNVTISVGAGASNILRVADYNLAASGIGAPRTGLDTILQGIGSEVVAGNSHQIDLIALEEVQSQATTSNAVASLLNTAYSVTTYKAGLVDGASSGAGTQGMVYNSATLQLVSEVALGTVSGSGIPRQVLRYLFHPIAVVGAASDFYMYVSHTKSSTGASNETRRNVEAQLIRTDADALGAGKNIIYAGDFNLYSNSEAFYQTMIGAGNGQANDPYGTGNWKPSSTTTLKAELTQAPAVSPPSGLVGGGLNDRFDFQLMSSALSDSSNLEYVTGSFHTFGNDGSVPVSGNVNDPSSTALSGLGNRLTILNNLTTVTDHLPVVADYIFNSAGGNIAPIVGGPSSINVAPSAVYDFAGAYSITDPDSANETVTISVPSGNGTFAVVAGTGVTATITGSGTESVTITGTKVNVNAVLAATATGASFKYTAPASPGTITMTVLANDTIVNGNPLTTTINVQTSGNGVIIFNDTGVTYTQNFNTLASTGTSQALPTGWTFTETGTNANTTYAADSGTGTSGNTYSYGTTGSTDRAFGGLQSGSLVPTIGAAIQNTTGLTLQQFTIAYTGEQWRIGTAGRPDSIVFQYSTNATSLTDAGATWTNVSGLNFTGPIQSPVGALDGNASGNRAALSSIVGGISVADQGIIWIRWTDTNASGADDGLAVDDFSFSASDSPVNSAPTITGVGPTTSKTVWGTTVDYGNPIPLFSISDADSTNDTLTVHVTAGTVTATAAGSAMVTGSGTSTMVISGTLGDVNGSLGTLVFTAPTSGNLSVMTLQADDGAAINNLSTVFTQNIVLYGYQTYATNASSYTQNFDTLVATGASSTTPTGINYDESGSAGDLNYAADAGGTSSGGVYSYGTGTNTDRAFGGLRTGTVVPTLGAIFQNTTGSTLQQFSLNYTGEQWRRGGSGTADELVLEYSTDPNTVNFNTGTWTEVSNLDFFSPNTSGAGAGVDGNAAGNRTALSATVGAISVAPNALLWFRWRDVDVSGSDDGLAVDDLSFSASSTPINAAPVLTGPSSAKTLWGTSYVFDGGTNPTFNVTDADSTNETVTINVLSGTLTATASGSATATPSNSNHTMTIAGPISDVNATLASLTYAAPTAGASDTMTVQANDGAGQNNLSNTVTTSIVLYTWFTYSSGTYTQDFDTLANTGSSTTTPTGWNYDEAGTGGDLNYVADTGASSSGGVYSYGAASATDRALGTLQTGTNVPTIAAIVKNTTGSTLTQFVLSYTGEQWRRNNNNNATPDTLQFEYSTDATSFSTGTWTLASTLDFSSPNTLASAGGTALDGNASGNNAAVSATITGLSVPNNSILWLRWVDVNISGSDDGLAVDNVSFNNGVATTSFTITTNADSGSGSLRQALIDAQATPASPHTFTFQIPGGATTINPATALPGVTSASTVVMDGTQNVTIGVGSGITWDNYTSLILTGSGVLKIGGNQSSHPAASTMTVQGGTLDLLSNAGNNVSLAVGNATGTPKILLDASQTVGNISVTANGTAGVVAKGASGVLAAQPALVNFAGDPLGYGPGDKYVIANNVTVAAGGHFDVNDGILVINNGTFGAVNAAVHAGRIFSSTVQYDSNNLLGLTGLGMGDNFDLSYAGIGPNNQLTITGSLIPAASDFGQQFIFKYTYIGDANLDGKVTTSDYDFVFGNLGSTTNGVTGNPVIWGDGDLNGNGVVDTTDLDNLFANLGFGTTGNVQPPLRPSTSSSGATDVALASTDSSSLIDDALVGILASPSKKNSL